MGAIVGELRIVRGSFPDHRIMVKLQTRGSDVAVIYADDQGTFAFDNLIANQYTVVVNDGAYQSVSSAVSLNPHLTPVIHVNLTLVPRENKKEPTPSEVSGANPNMVSPADYNTKWSKKAVNEFNKGVKAEKEQRPNDAIHDYEKAIREAPDFYPAYNNLGSAYLKKGDLAEAEKQFRAAMQMNRNDAQSFFNLANVLLLTNRAPEAAQFAMEGLRKQPNSAFGNFVLGSALERSGDYPQAQAALRRALELDPTLTKAHLELVNLYLQQQKKAEAIAELQSFLKDSPNDALAPKVREVLKRLQATK